MSRRGWLLLPALLLLAGLATGQVQRVPTSGASLVPLSSDGTHLTLASGQIRLPDGTAGAPSLALSDETNTGFFQPTASRLSVSVAGTERVRFGATTDLGATGLGWGASAGSPDLILTRDAANTLAQRNATNAQALRVYNTYTDASNYERALVGWIGNVFIVGLESAGTGSASRTVRFRAGNTDRWEIPGATGHLLASTDNAVDIGASGATRPRSLYTASYVFPGSVAFASLGSPSNGATIYCSDCTKATPCASGGSGALAKRLNGAWDCN